MGPKVVTNPITFCVQSPVRLLNIDSKASELIDEGKKEWKHDLIICIFQKEEVEVISQCSLVDWEEGILRFGVCQKVGSF